MNINSVEIIKITQICCHGDGSGIRCDLVRIRGWDFFLFILVLGLSLNNKCSKMAKKQNLNAFFLLLLFPRNAHDTPTCGGTRSTPSGGIPLTGTMYTAPPPWAWGLYPTGPEVYWFWRTLRLFFLVQQTMIVIMMAPRDKVTQRRHDTTMPAMAPPLM